MTTCKGEALRWVHIYAAGGAAFAANPLPLSTSAGLAALETHMAGFIGAIYGDPMGGPTTAAAGGTFAVMGQGLKYLAAQATCFIPFLGPAIRVSIAAVTIESIGRALVAHYERKFPGKVLAPKPKPEAA
jgi:uncharacterized protein (DUF697 family)